MKHLFQDVGQVYGRLWWVPTVVFVYLLVFFMYLAVASRMSLSVHL